MPTNRNLIDEGYKMPAVNDAPRLCVKLEIPNDPDHIANFLGALEELTFWFNYRGNDPTRRKRLIARTWRDIWYNIEFEDSCEAKPKLGSLGADFEDFMLRQNPDNPCLIETSLDGVNWCLVVDISKCKPGTGQPGAGAEQPRPNGGCVVYNADLQAAYTWLLPTVVNEGDTIEILAYIGAWYDGGLPMVWNCPNGAVFFAGACIGEGVTESTDPLPTAKHMSVIARIGSTYYDMSTIFTVPSGVVNGQVEFMANDVLRSDNSGAIGFDVRVCNNQQTGFQHHFDFLVSDGGFVHGWSIDGRGDGTWEPTVGWKGDPSGGDSYECIIKRTMPAGTKITRIDAQVHFDVLNFNRNTVAAVQSTLGAAGIGTAAETYSTTFPTGTNGNNISFGIGSGGNSSPEGPFQLISADVFGLGPDPF